MKLFSLMLAGMLLALGAQAAAPSGTWRMPARQVSVNSNDWEVLAPTNDNTQATFDWIDDNMITLDLLNATSNAIMTYADSNFWTIVNQNTFSNLVWDTFPEPGSYVTSITNMGSSGTSNGVISELTLGHYAIWFPSVAGSGGGSTTYSTNEYSITFDCVAGTIQTFAMSNAPAGWLECDGSSVSSNDYPDLWAAIGTNYGGTGPTDFLLPDYRGQFLRGWDHGAGVDPDAATRTPGGDVVGSTQNDTNRAHTHATSYSVSTHGHDSYTNLWSGALTNDAASWAVPTNIVGVTIASTSASGPDGGSESRPVNISVLFCIKHSNSTNSLSNLATTNWVSGNFLPGTNIADSVYNPTTLTWTVYSSATNYIGPQDWAIIAQTTESSWLSGSAPGTYVCAPWSAATTHGAATTWFNTTSGAFLPTKAGWYRVSANIPYRMTSANATRVFFYSTRSGYHIIQTAGAGNDDGDYTASGSFLVYFNGTTDSGYFGIQSSGVVYAPYNQLVSRWARASFVLELPD